MKTITVTGSQGAETVITLAHLVAFTKDGGNPVAILLSSGDQFYVKESMDKIRELIRIENNLK